MLSEKVANTFSGVDCARHIPFSVQHQPGYIKPDSRLRQQSHDNSL